VAKRRNRRKLIICEIRVYFEGDKRLRPGFKAFFREIDELAKSKACRFELIATEGTPVPDFLIALEEHPDAWNVLLIDSDRAVTDTLFQEKCGRLGLKRLHFHSVFWMVQIMEAWFLADVEALQSYYDQHFQRSAVRSNPDVEQIPKEDVLAKLKSATRKCQKGEYQKTNHAPELLGLIRPELVRAASRQCQRIFDVVRNRLDNFDT
jgi:hypothetical protein